MQKPVIKRVLTAAPGLAGGLANWDHSMSPYKFGVYGAGMWVREYSPAVGSESTARAIYVQPVYKPSAPAGGYSATINSTNVPFQKLRPGAEYDLYYTSAALSGGAFDSFNLPCEIDEGQQAAGGGAGCTGQIHLCDPHRLTGGGFSLQTGPHLGTGATDCWWEATTSGAELDIPATTIAAHTLTSCHLTLSMEWAPGLTGSVSVQRHETDGTWSNLFVVNAGAPYLQPDLLSNHLYSYAFEGNSNLASHASQSFRVLLNGAGDVRVYDPLIYCEWGGLP
jgi:hypothetical protein